MLEIKKHGKRDKECVNKFIRRLKTAKETITELEDRSTEIYVNLDSRRVTKN